MTAPPVPDATVPALAWMATDVPRIRDGEAVAVSFGPTGFVAVGGVTGWRPDGNGGFNGFPLRPFILRSSDGVTWSEAALDFDIAGIELQDVAAGPGGYVAVGNLDPGPVVRRVVILRSEDGLSWEPAALPNPDDNRSAWRVAWTGESFVVSVTAHGEPLPVELASPDGRAWTSREVPYQRWLVPTTAGWLGIGPLDTWTTPDGGSWEADALTGPRGGTDAMVPERGAVTPGGTVLTGYFDGGCNLFGNCEYGTAAWWSSDARHWSALPSASEGWPFGGSTTGVHVLGGGEGLAVYANDRDTWASVDGWRWQPLVADGPLVPSDQAVRDIAVETERSCSWAAGSMAPGSCRRSPWRSTPQCRRPSPGGSPIEDVSIASTLPKRRRCRGSPEKRAARNAAAHSTAGSIPMTRAPIARTFMSSCSTPWCARVGVVAEPRPDAPHLVDRDGRPHAGAADQDPPVRVPGLDGLAEQPREVRVVVLRVGAVAAEIDQLVVGRQQRLQPRQQLVLERGSSVIGRQRNAHRRRLLQPCPCGWPRDGSETPTRPRSPSRTTRRPTDATFSAVNPKASRIVPAGALAPNRSSPRIAPSSPAHRSQPRETPASTVTRLRTSAGSTLSR